MPELKLHQKTSYEFIEEQPRLAEVVKEIVREPIVAVDLEGTGLDPHADKILLLQLATPKKAYVLDVRRLDLKPLEKILSNAKILKLIQNAKFDYGMLKAQVGMEIENIFDTMLAERILTTGISRENSLGAIALKYLDIELAKESWKSFAWGSFIDPERDFPKRHLDYAASDVLVLFPIYEAQKPRLVKEGLTEIAALEFRLVPVVAEMELKGSLIDVARWRGVITDYQRRANEVAQKLQDELRPYWRHVQRDLFGNHADVINLNSPIQILEAFRRVGLDLPSTGEEILARYDHPLTKLLLEYRGYEKIITAFGENLLSKINPKTGRIHPDYMQIGADTGRFACSNPNLQQIPTDSRFRHCFIPAPGYTLVVADYSQIELRVMAELSEDPEFMRAYKEDKDLHTLTASQMYGVPASQVGKRMRRAAKDINFGLMYGRGAKSLAAQLGVSEGEARELLKKYFRVYRQVKRWLDETSKEAVRRGYSRTLGGRKRYYQKVDPDDPTYERRISYIERQGKNTPIQGSSADMTKLALIYVRDRIRREGFDATPIHTVHDEILVEARVEEGKKVAKAVQGEMERAGREFLSKVPVKVDVVVSDVWEH